MTDSQQRPNRSTAFWFVLAIHIALGTALYIHSQDATTPAKTAKHVVETPETMVAP